MAAKGGERRGCLTYFDHESGIGSQKEGNIRLSEHNEKVKKEGCFVPQLHSLE